jgi:hypothetical protein
MGSFWRGPWQKDGDTLTFLYTLEAANAAQDNFSFDRRPADAAGGAP